MGDRHPGWIRPGPKTRVIRTRFAHALWEHRLIEVSQPGGRYWGSTLKQKKSPNAVFGGAFSGVTGILPVSRFGDGNKNGESAYSCSLIHSKCIRHGRCWWDGWWELAVVLQCRHFLHKPKAEFENTTARAQKASTHKSTHESTHESTESRKAGKAQEREHESTRAREHESKETRASRRRARHSAL